MYDRITSSIPPVLVILATCSLGMISFALMIRLLSKQNGTLQRATRTLLLFGILCVLVAVVIYVLVASDLGSGLRTAAPNGLPIPP